MSRWLKILLLGLAVAGVALLFLPWWLDVPLRPILAHWNITYDRYEREGYAHFRIRQVRYTHPAVEVTAGQVEAPTPLLWLAQRLGGTPPLLRAENWRVQPGPGPKSTTPPKPDSGWIGLHRILQRVAGYLTTWLPRADVANGEVRGFGPRLYFAQLAWHDGELHTDGFGIAGLKLAADLTPGDTFALKARTADNTGRLELAWSGADATGSLALWDQPARLAARFPSPGGWLPDEASVTAENWQVPATRVKLGVPYAAIHGGAKFAWRDGAFELTADADAVPMADAKKVPPLSVHAAARGSLRAVTVTTLAIDAPFATGRLSAPVTFSLDEPADVGPAQLAVKVDLGKMPWIDAHGRAEGTVTVSGRDAAARQDFALEFADVELPGLNLKQASARGRLQWPELEVAELSAQLDESSRASAKGKINWQTRELADVSAQARLDAAWFKRWLPAGTSWTTAEISATAEGPLDAPRLTGSAKVRGLTHTPLHATDIDGTWRSQGKAVEFSATTRTGGSTLELAGTVDADSLQLAKLQVSPAGQPVWQLARPVRVVREPVWAVEALELGGPAGRLTFSGHGGADESFALGVTGFDSAWLQDWITLAGPAWQLHALQAAGHFKNGVLIFSTEATARIAMTPQPAEVKLAAEGDGDGVRLRELTVTESGRELTHATGRLPVSWVNVPSPQLRLDENGPLEFTAATEPDSPLWATLATFTGVQLEQPAAKINLGGTARQPTGDIQLKAKRLAPDGRRFQYALPDLADLAVAVHLERTAVTVTDLSANVDGQPVKATGRLPMDDTGWQKLWRQPAAFDWTQATARVDIANADLAPVARRFPKFVAAQGFLRASVALHEGGKLSGELHLTDAASRPLPPFGTLQEIQADLVLEDRQLNIQKLTAKLGGEPVALTGGVTFVPGGAPRLALGLKGQNLPIVRNTGLLLRADFDLQANTNAAGAVTLGGRIDVRDCLLLASLNLRTLLPSAKGVTRQPPYFSVAAEPYAHWPLAVDVTARKSIRLRTSVFNGTASGHFRLGGTLGEPRAVGEVTTDEGRVLFPFATFTVKSGSVRLREADPFHAVVALTATSQRRDYQLQLEATGELPSPNILLTSSPALEPSEVLLLVMTGQPPESMAATTTSSSGAQRLALLGAYLSRGLFQDLGAGGENRLEISAGAEVSEQGRDTYEFEYKLGERSSLVGEYDRFDSYNGGFKWRAYTQESVPVEKKK